MLYDAKRDFGKWAYLLIIIMVPIFIFAKIFGIQNKSYEMKNYS